MVLESKQPSNYVSISDAKIKSSITSYNSNSNSVSQPIQQQKSTLVIREQEEGLDSQDVNYDY